MIHRSPESRGQAPEPDGAASRLAEELDYWLAQLAELPEPAGLPPDRVREPGTDRSLQRSRLVLPDDLRATVERASRGKASLALVLFTTAVAVRLHQVEGAADLVVGSPIHEAHRDASPLNRMLAIRIPVEPSSSLRDLVSSVRKVFSEAYAHQRLPLSRVMREIRGEEASGLPFRVGVALEGVNDPENLRSLGLELAFVVETDEAGPTALVVENDPAVLEQESAERLGRDVLRTVRLIPEAPETRVEAVPRFEPGEEERLLREVNDTSAELPDARVHELFTQVAASRPSAIAVTGARERLTYAELEELSGRLAAHLAERGVERGDRVGFLLANGVDTPVAALGILRSGAAFVPFDVATPRERLAMAVEDAGIRLLLHHAEDGDGLAELAVSRLVLDRDRTLWDRPREATPVDGDPADLAYVIYTSGSTGRPKGVAVEHRSLGNYLSWAARVYLQGEYLAFPLYSSPAFDLTLTSLFAPLLTGGQLVAYDDRSDVPLLDVLEDDRVEVLKLTPSHLALMRHMDLSASRVRRLIVGGEALAVELARAIHEAFRGGVEIYNEYGPTETTVGCTVHRFDPAQGRRAFVPIGRPADNVRVYLLDADDRAVGPASVGEIHVGGAGVARGYLGREKLTADRFVADPFVPGERMYRTGDLGRWLPGDRLDYLGRRDDQVKFNAHRIELGEIRWALQSHPDIRDGVARLTEGPGGEAALVGYYVSREAIAPAELRRHLERYLPVEVVPGFFVHLKRLPLTLSGKVNVEALPDLHAVREQLRRSYTAPRTSTEQVLADSFARVLRLDRVGIHESFFELGGHSLLATQVISRIRVRLGVEPPLRTVFEAPTVARLAERVDRKRREDRPDAESQAIEAVPRDQPIPLSFAQQRLWFLERLQPGNPFYNVPIALHLEGRLDLPLLVRSFREVVRRHEVLRTRFPVFDGEPVQRIEPVQRLPVPVVDLSGLSAAAREREGARWIRKESRRPFDLERGPLLRILVERLAPKEHVALVALHHTVTDAWSNVVLVRETTALYGAFGRGETSPLPELPIQYADFAAWQRRWLREEQLQRQLNYWRTRLDGAPPLLELPTDRPRPPVKSFRGSTVEVDLSAALTEGLEALARERGVSLFMVLLAGFQALLSRYSGQKDISVGTPSAGRHRLELEDLIGFFVNTLVMRLDLSDDPELGELIDRTRNTVLEGHAHQDLPFERLVEELQPERSLSYTPLFQVWLTLQNVPQEPGELEGLWVVPMATRPGTAKFDLTLSLQEGREGLTGSIEYSSDLFDETSVLRLAGHLETLLDAAVAAPSRRLSDLSLLSPRERFQIVAEWNDTTVPPPSPAPLPYQLRAQIRRTPDSVAVCTGGGHVSYAGLDRRARVVAGQLRAAGLLPGARLGVLLDHSIEMVAALCGAVEAGVAYVPLDPAAPRARLELMVEDAGLQAVLTDRPLEWLPGGVREIPVSDQVGAAGTGVPEGAEVQIRPEDSAYVLYTSGSTGRPKGVEIPHSALADYLDWAASTYTADRRLAFAFYSSLAFDLTVTSLWLPLVTGGRIEVFPFSERQVPIEEIFASGRADVVKLTPSHLAFLEGRDLSDSRVTRLIAGGEALPADVAGRIHGTLGPELEIFNEYGPTEATVGCTVHRFDPSSEARGDVPIGRPAANAGIFVLDEGLRPVPPNVSGELFISGPGLARGYLGREEITAERFLVHPFVEGARLYRSGDIARQRPDGVLEYLGRADDQVKFHGYRVELGEIRAALLEHPQVREAVVRLLEDAEGRPVLVGYYVAREPISTADLRAFLGERLLEETVPSLLVSLKRLPLTLNGKVNLEALPGIDAAKERLARSYDSPRSDVEQFLARVFAEVLRLERVGIHESFFELGGHSLMATRIIARVREGLGVEPPLRSLFETPTVATLAGRIEVLRREARRPGLPAVERVPRNGPLPLSYPQQSFWLATRLDPADPSYNVPLVVRLVGRLDRHAFRRSLIAVAERHEALQMVFEVVDGVPRQTARAEVVGVPVVDLRGAADPESTALDLAEREVARPFDLAVGPPMRATLVALADDEHLLLLTFHHIICDGWSMDVLAREVTILYGAFLEGLSSPLPELPIQYGDFAVWQRRYLDGPDGERLMEFWRDHLSEPSTPTRLPADRVTTAHETRGAIERSTVGAEVTTGLRHLAREERASLFMCLLAAFKALLWQYTGDEDVVVGTSTGTRVLPEVEELIGLFINTLPLRTDLSGNPTLRELVGRVRKMFLEVDAYRDVPSDWLVGELRSIGGLNSGKPFHTMLVLQNAPFEDLRLPGLRLEAVAVERRIAKYDLTLFVQERAGDLHMSFEYDCGRFEADTIQGLIDSFLTLLERFAGDPDTPLDAASEGWGGAVEAFTGSLDGSAAEAE